MKLSERRIDACIRDQTKTFEYTGFFETLSDVQLTDKLPNRQEIVRMQWRITDKLERYLDEPATRAEAQVKKDAERLPGCGAAG